MRVPRIKTIARRLSPIKLTQLNLSSSQMMWSCSGESSNDARFPWFTPSRKITYPKGEKFLNAKLTEHLSLLSKIVVWDTVELFRTMKMRMLLANINNLSKTVQSSNKFPRNRYCPASKQIEPLHRWQNTQRHSNSISSRQPTRAPNTTRARNRMSMGMWAVYMSVLTAAGSLMIKQLGNTKRYVRKFSLRKGKNSMLPIIGNPPMLMVLGYRKIPTRVKWSKNKNLPLHNSSKCLLARYRSGNCRACSWGRE